MLRGILAAFGFAVVSAAGVAVAQAPPLELPDASQAATVTQRIGLTDLTVTYHRPAVRGRKIWGGLVPLGDVWRAGANENTVLTISSPAKVGGVPVEAGRYGLHMIANAGEWTVILNRDADAWGSFFYDQARDAARFTVRPAETTPQEYLSYSFDDPEENRVTLTLRWEKVAVPIPIEVDTASVVTASLERQLRGLPGFYWQSYATAAAWCARHNTNLDRALVWADRAMGMTRNFATLRAKAAVLERKGQTEESKTLLAEALRMATEPEMNAYGYELLGAGEFDEAIAIFRENIKRHPESWNTYDSLGEALAAKGQTAEAIEQYQKALSMVDDEAQKKRINGILAKLTGRS